MLNGVIFWNNQTGTNALTPVAYRGAYNRLTIQQLRSGAGREWLRAMTGRGLPVGIAMQEVVPWAATSAVPADLFIGAYDKGIGAFVPNYLDPTFLPRFAAELDKLAADLASYPYGIEVQIAIGCYGENNFYGMSNRAWIPDETTESGRKWFDALIDLYLARWKPEQLRVGTDNLYMLDSAYRRGVRLAFRHSIGYNRPDTDHFGKPWQNVLARQQLEQMQVMVEPYRTNTLTDFSAEKMYYQLVAHPEITAIADGNTDLSRRTAAEQQWIEESLRLIDERTRPVATSTAALEAELAATLLMLNDAKELARSTDEYKRKLQDDYFTLERRFNAVNDELTKVTDALNQKVIDYNALQNEKAECDAAYAALHDERDVLETERNLLQARVHVLSSKLITLAQMVALAESRRQSVLEFAQQTLDNEMIQ